MKPKQDWFEEVLTMEGRNKVISSSHIWLGAPWKSNNDWQKEGKLGARVTENDIMLRQVSAVHQSNSALYPSSLFQWGTVTVAALTRCQSQKETVTPLQQDWSAEGQCTGYGDNPPLTLENHPAPSTVCSGYSNFFPFCLDHQSCLWQHQSNLRNGKYFTLSPQTWNWSSCILDSGEQF